MIKDLFIYPEKNLKDALNKLSETGEKCLIVIKDKQKKILGTLSDGDIRKAILKNFDLTQKIEFIYKKNPYVLLQNKFSKKDANKLFLDYKIDLIPIVDEKSKVKDFISWNNFFGDKQKNKELNIPVIIMAGGKGDRLQPFTKVLPKPLIPINDKPIIEHVIENFLKFGIKNYYLSVNFKSRVLKAYFEESKHNYEISFLEEDKPLGTSGSLKLLKKHNLKSFIVTNCDTIIDIDLNDFYEFHKTNNNDISFVVTSKNFTIPYGICDLDQNEEFEKIKEKHNFNFLVNTGLYMVESKIIDLIPDNSTYDMNELINNAKNNKMKVGVFPVYEESWIDIGQWGEYKKTVEKFEI